jgi:glucose/arabinose dehydrogenase
VQMKLFAVVWLVVLLALGLAACGQQAAEIEPSSPIFVATDLPSAGPTAGVTSTAHPTQPPATSVSSPLPAEASPSPIPPSVTPSFTPSRLPPTGTPLPEASSTPTTAPSPQASPVPTGIPAAPADLASLRLELKRVTGGLETPVGVAHAGDGSGRLFVVEKVGRIRVVQDGILLSAPMLDISDRVGSSQSEQGLLGLAFHPGFVENGLFFVNYTDRQGDTVVSKFSMAGPLSADAGSERVLLKLDQPAANHNGGHLAFGPDGYLYIGTGDGGAAGDKFGNGQNGATLLGAMLRLDVDGGEPYAIPADNPFVGNSGVRDEIWAIGLRNPWRYSFDRLTGDLYIADVGQNVYEEVDLQPASSPGGENYGWPIMEASHCFPAERNCDQVGLTLPVLEYDHSQGCSITGGYVYRGLEFPALQGVYLFGDFCSGKIWGAAVQSESGQPVVELARADVQLSSFGEDEAGELYLLDMGQGELFKLVVQTR